MSEYAERAVAREGQQTFLTHARWKLWFSRRGRLQGIAIVHPASDYALRLEANGLDEQNRIEYCERLCDVLNVIEGRRERLSSLDGRAKRGAQS